MLKSLFYRPEMPNLRPTLRLTLTGLMIALGVIVPYVTGHAVGVPGTVFLPMHLPVLLAGLLTGPFGGLAAGLLTPVISSLLTNMPPVYPMLPIMTAQLAVMGILIGALTHRLRIGVLPALVLSSAAGWIVYGIVFRMLLLMNPNLRALSVVAALGTGIPGLVVQLIVVPVLYLAVLRALRQPEGRPEAAAVPSGDVLRRAQAMIREAGCSCVVIRDGVIIHTADGRGVKPLIGLLDHAPEQLVGSMIVDRVIGKGAAMILVNGGARYAYGALMSESGRDYLERHGIEARYGTLLPFVPNRDRTGMCPIEDAVKDLTDPAEGLAAIRDRIAELMAGQGASASAGARESSGE